MKKIFLIACLLQAVAYAQNTDSVVNVKMKLAARYAVGYNAHFDPVKSLKLYGECAEAGNAKAMNALGVQYRLGLGTDTNFTASFAWFKKAAESGYPRAWFNLGLLYKYGTGTVMDYAKAYSCFKKAAELGEPSGYYGQGYMLYKGLGCPQDYAQAIVLFNKGALAGKASCMYLLGLCYRNGYGTALNKDSARYWLTLSASLGYSLSKDELFETNPENLVGAGTLMQNIEAAKKLSANTSLPVNQYTPVVQSMPVSDIAGEYDGYLLKYDYSGKHIIQAASLHVQLSYMGNDINGVWTEADSISIPLQAVLTNQGLLFKDMQYRKNDHYHPVNALSYYFQNASLQVNRNNDSIFLSGNVTMYTPDRKEPEKPLQVILYRTGRQPNDTGIIAFTDPVLKSPLVVYPNPFNNLFNVQFTLKQPCTVYTQLVSIDGKVVYTQPAAMLQAGSYVLPLQPHVAAGSYIVRLVYGNKTSSSLILKVNN